MQISGAKRIRGVNGKSARGSGVPFFHPVQNRTAPFWTPAVWRQAKSFSSTCFDILSS
jgi:hypothetical protein